MSPVNDEQCPAALITLRRSKATVRALRPTSAARTAGPIFLNRDGGPLAEPTVWRLIRRLTRTAGIPAAN